MATTFVDYTGDGNATKSFSFPSIKEADIKVEVDDVLKTSGNHYNITSYTVTGGGNVVFTAGNIPTSPAKIRILRDTDVDSAKADYTAGSSVRAADLNNNQKQVLYAAQEEQNQIRTSRIQDIAVTTAKIRDDAVTMAKLSSGVLPTDITVASANLVDGTIVDADVNSSAAIAGTKVTPAFGSQNVSTSGTLASGGQTVTGNITVSGTVDGRDIATDGTKLDGIEAGATADQTSADIRTLVEAATDSNVFTDADHSKLNAIEPSATADQSSAEIRAAVEAASDSNVFTDADHNKLDGIETAATGDQTASEIKTLLQSDKLTASEIATGALDGRYYTETEAEAKFLRQDSSETIASGVTWSSSDAFVATTAAIDARVIELVDNVGGFVPIANETSFPTANPDINNPATGGTIVSVKAASTNLAPSGTTVTIANGRGSGLAVIITGVTATIPSGFGFLVETTSTDHTYAFHRLVPKATEVTTVASNAVNIAAAGANVVDINNFADLYQISTSAPTQRADTSSLQVGDLWFDSSSNKVLMIYDGSSGDGFTAATPNASDLTNINIVAGQITYQEDLGLITNAVNTGSGNNSVNTVATSIANVNTAATNIAKITTVADDLNEGTSEIDTVATNIANVNTVGTNISNINAVNSNESNINAVQSNATNINAVSNNTTNINTVATNNTNINTVAGANSNITTVAGSISNVNTAATNIASINTTASNIANVNNFTDKYQVASSNPSTDGGGNALAAGDLYFNTSANELKVYTGSAWQGGVTATGNFAAKTGNTFTGNNIYNDNVVAKFGTGGDLEIYHDGNNSYIRDEGDGALILTSTYYGIVLQKGSELMARFLTDGAVELYHNNNKKFDTTTTGIAVTGLMSATTIDGAAGDNLQLDFGTL